MKSMKLNLCMLYLFFLAACTVRCNATPQEQFRTLISELVQNKENADSTDRKEKVAAIVKLIKEQGDETFLHIYDTSPKQEALNDAFLYLINPRPHVKSFIGDTQPLYVHEIIDIGTALIDKIGKAEKINAALNYKKGNSSSPLALAFERAYKGFKDREEAGDTTLIQFLADRGIDFKVNVENDPFALKIIKGDNFGTYTLAIDNARLKILDIVVTQSGKAKTNLEYVKDMSFNMLMAEFETNSHQVKKFVNDIEVVTKVLISPAMITKILDINPNCINEQDKDGYTALHKAVRSKNEEAICILLNKGANPNIQDERHKNTPLHLLGESEGWPADAYERILKKFNEKKANFAIKNAYGQTYQDKTQSRDKSVAEGNKKKKDKLEKEKHEREALEKEKRDSASSTKVVDGLLSNGAQKKPTDTRIAHIAIPLVTIVAVSILGIKAYLRNAKKENSENQGG